MTARGSAVDCDGLGLGPGAWFASFLPANFFCVGALLKTGFFMVLLLPLLGFGRLPAHGWGLGLGACTLGSGSAA